MANPLSDMYDFVMPYCPGATSSFVDSQIRRVMRQFLRRSTILRELLPLTLTPNVNSLVLTPTTAGLEVAGVLWLRVNTGFDTGAVQFNPIHQLQEESGYRSDNNAVTGAPRGYNYFTPSAVIVSPPPDKAYPVQVEVYETTPLDGSVTTYPPACSPYLDVIGRGVVAELMGMPAKPFSDPQHAMLYQKLFGERTLAIRDELRQGGSRSVATARGPRFGA